MLIVEDGIEMVAGTVWREACGEEDGAESVRWRNGLVGKRLCWKGELVGGGGQAKAKA